MSLSVDITEVECWKSLCFVIDYAVKLLWFFLSRHMNCLSLFEQIYRYF
jgi:hypothetical protein